MVPRMERYSGTVLTTTDQNYCLMSYQCMDDIESCLIGFTELCPVLLSRSGVDEDVLIIPFMIN